MLEEVLTWNAEPDQMTGKAGGSSLGDFHMLAWPEKAGFLHRPSPAQTQRIRQVDEASGSMLFNPLAFEVIVHSVLCAS